MHLFYRNNLFEIIKMDLNERRITAKIRQDDILGSLAEDMSSAARWKSVV